MLKEDYKKIVTERPWTPISEHFNNLPITEVNKLTNLDINTEDWIQFTICLLYTSPSPRDRTRSRMPSSA